MAVTSQQVIDTYKYYLNRTPGTAEVNFWVDYSKANGAAQTNAAFLAGARSELQDITRSAYQSTLGRTPSATELDYWTNYALSAGIQQAASAFNVGAQEEIARRSPPPPPPSPPPPPTEASLPPLTDPKIVQTLVEQLKNQYEIINKNVGYSYQFPDRLDRLFEEQAQALAKTGITNIYDVGVKTIEKDVPINVIKRPIYDSNDNFTGRFDYLKPIGVEGFGESETPTYGPLNSFELANLREIDQGESGSQTTTITKIPVKILINKQTGQQLQTGFREENELRQFAGVDIWGGANLGKGLDLFSIQFSADGAPIFVPIWQETSDRRTIGQILALVATFYAPQLGKFLAPTASAATQAAIGGAVIGGGTAAITGENVLTGAIKGAIGSITTTTYATDVGKALGITSDVAARTVGNALINSGLSGVQAALTPGADVGKSMLAGAVTGAVSVNATELAKTVLGDNFIKQIEQITNLTANDVGNIFSNSIVQSVVAAINDQDAAKAFINTAISNGVSQSVANSMWTGFQDSFKGREDVLSGIVTAAKGVVDTGVNASLYNQNVKQAIENAVPGIIVSSFRAYNLTADEMLKRQQKEEKVRQTAIGDAVLLAGPPSADLLRSLKAREAVGETVLYEGFDEELDHFYRRVEGFKNDGTKYGYGIHIYDDGTILYTYYDPNQPNNVALVENRPSLQNAPSGVGVDKQAPQVQRQPLPTTGLIDLRTFLSNLTPGGQVVFSRTPGVVGGTTQKGSTGFSFIGKDGSGRDRFQIGGINFTVISIDGKDVFVNDPFDVFLEPVVDPVTRKPELKPTPESEPFNPPQQTPAPQPEPQPQPTPEREPTTPTAPRDEGKTGAEGASGVAGGAPSGPSQAAPSLTPSPGAVVRPKTTIPSVPGTTAPEITPTAPPTNVVTVVDAQNYFDKTKDQTGTKIILEVAAGTRPAEDAIRVLQQANLVPVESAVDRDAEIVILKEIEQQLEAERQAIERGRAERIEQARVTRTEREQAQYEKEQAEFEKALEDLEADIAKARSDEEKAQARQIFTTQQRERLRETGRLTGGLQSQIDAELGNLLDQYEDAQRRAGRAVTQKEGLVAPQQPGDVGRGISDQDVIDFLGLGSEEAERYGFFGDTEGVAGGLGPGSGVEGEGPGSGGEGTGPGSGETGVGPGAGDEGFGPGGGAEDVITQLRPIVIYDQTGAPRPTQGIPQRVTAQAVEGILGDKEPLFGGDEDEQRAIWNRRSLRLRKALGL